MSQNRLDAKALAEALPDYLPDPVDRNALIAALAIVTATVIGVLVPPERQAGVIDAFSAALRDGVESGRQH